MPVTRPKELGSEEALDELRRDAIRLDEAQADLRFSVKKARRSGASIRVIAEHSGLSTRTVQDWLKQD